MNVTQVLLDILIVLLVAKAAAEVAERLGVPAVVGEILAGVLIGPSALGLLNGNDEVLHVLGELGVILLLLDVGMEMDLRELAAVGRASLSVAAVGVVVPFAAGWAACLALGMEGNEAMFVGAALTATSVGITARVFGDLRALATVEARTVLGAAVADDVIGLVILTVVVRLASEGGVDPAGVAAILLVALGFLVVTGWAGVKLAPRLFEGLTRISRSSGTLVAVALAFTLGVSELASAARLAPIVGAFVAGIALSRCAAADRIRRELTPVGHLFIPVFFLQIGTDADVGRFADAGVLGLAAVLLAIGIAGKLAASAGLLGSPGDRLLVGIGMVPRGEVGLIFATIGLREGVFGEDVYAALLLVVLVTTLLTPPLLRWRLLRLRSDRQPAKPSGPKPPGGWLVVAGAPRGGTVELAAEPPPTVALPIALEAALRGDQHQPGPRLLEFLSALPDQPLRWDAPSRELLFSVLERGGPRAWRFLAVTGMLDRALPELGAALSRRQSDAFELDPTRVMHWPTLNGVRDVDGRRLLTHPEWLLLAAVILDATDEEGQVARVATARRIMQRLGLGAAAEQFVAGLVEDTSLLPAAARRLDSLGEEAVLQLAVHLRSADRARASMLLAEAQGGLSAWERDRLRQLHDALQDVLAHPELTGRAAANAVEQRRSAALRLATEAPVRDRIAAAPRSYLVATPPDEVAGQAALCEPPPGREGSRIAITPLGNGTTYRIDVVARHRLTLLAAETRVLADAGIEIADATVATWGDGCTLASFRASSPAPPDASALEHGLQAHLAATPAVDPVPDASVTFDHDSSPWHSRCTVRARDRRGLLHAVTSAIAGAGATVHSARVTTVAGEAVDLFELTDRHGHKLDDATATTIETILTQGLPGGHRALRWRNWRMNRPLWTATTNGSGNRQEPASNRQSAGDRRETTAP